MSDDDDDEARSPRPPWTWRDYAGAIGFPLVLVWLLALAGTDDMSQRLTNAGEAVGAVSGALAAAAFIVAIISQRAQQKSSGVQEQLLRDRARPTRSTRRSRRLAQGRAPNKGD